MKKFLTNPVAIILTLLATAYFFFLFVSLESDTVAYSNYGQSSIINPLANDTSYGGVLYSPSVSYNLPYLQYKQVEDSLLQINNVRLRQNETFGSGFTTGLLGFREIIENENVQTVSKNKKRKQYFLSLGGFELEEDVKFYIEKNTYNLVYVQWDTVRRNGDNIERVGNYRTVEIPVRYSSSEQKIFIPISATQHTIGYILLIAIAILMLAFALYVIFGYPIQFLIRVSKGQAFSEANVAGLRATAILLFLFFIGSVVFPFLIRLIFSSFIHPLFKPLKFWPQLHQHLPTLFIAVLVFAIYIAFKKGYKLQQEQELTV